MQDKVRSRAVVLAAAAAAMATTVVAAPAASGVPSAESTGTISQITGSPVAEPFTSNWGAKVSDDGRFVAYYSDSASIVPDDDNGVGDVFLYDATTGQTKLISRTNEGAPANRTSWFPEISANGKYVVFTSEATDLAGRVHTEWSSDMVYRYNVTTGRVELISKTQSGKFPRYFSRHPAISVTGRYITYTSRAPKIVAGDHNGRMDVLRYDAVLDETILVSQTLSGGQTNRASFDSVISANGRYVAYSTMATNMGGLADTAKFSVVYRYDVETDTTTLVSHDRHGNRVGDTDATGISDNGKIISLLSEADDLAPGDTDDSREAYIYNAGTDRVNLVDWSSDPWPDGVDLRAPGLSGNGRYLTFEAHPLLNFGGSNVYLFDRRTRQTTKISVPPGGGDANGLSFSPSLSHDGNHIAFTSYATNLVPGDLHGNEDIFLWSRTVTP